MRVYPLLLPSRREIISLCQSRSGRIIYRHPMRSRACGTYVLLGRRGARWYRVKVTPNRRTITRCMRKHVTLPPACRSPAIVIERVSGHMQGEVRQQRPPGMSVRLSPAATASAPDVAQQQAWLAAAGNRGASVGGMVHPTGAGRMRGLQQIGSEPSGLKRPMGAPSLPTSQV